MLEAKFRDNPMGKITIYWGRTVSSFLKKTDTKKNQYAIINDENESVFP